MQLISTSKKHNINFVYYRHKASLKKNVENISAT
jgi:hypothetical protein